MAKKPDYRRPIEPPPPPPNRAVRDTMMQQVREAPENLFMVHVPGYQPTSLRDAYLKMIDDGDLVIRFIKDGFDAEMTTQGWLNSAKPKAVKH